LTGTTVKAMSLPPYADKNVQSFNRALFSLGLALSSEHLCIYFCYVLQFTF